jgi:hypothetical protein
MSTRLYHVKMKRKSVLVEARSQEQAVLKATKSLITSITIPTPMEAFRLKAEGAEIISDTLPGDLEPTPEQKMEMGREHARATDGEVGRMGLSAGEVADEEDAGE